MIGQSVASPGGYTAVMNENHHVTKPVMIGEIRGDGQFNVVYRSEPIVPVPWSPYLPGDNKVSAN
jgi:urea transport system substrate-binding protein